MEWFEARPGDLLWPSLDGDEPGMMLLHGGEPPDVVRLPGELGGDERRVEGVESIRCPCGGRGGAG